MVENQRSYKLKFSNAREIKTSLSTVANLVLNKKISHYEASTIASLCNVILKAEKQLDTDKELRELKEIILELEERL